MFLLHTNKSINKKNYLFIGLGNPGREYRHTRHNIGFICIDKIATSQKIKISRVKQGSLVGSGIVQNNIITLAKPQTFMNLSGKAVNSLIKYSKLPLNQILIIHDDMDLPLGVIRLRPAGSSGGQKGLDSIIQTVGTNQIPRLRVGIGRPPGKMNPMDYVLQNFNPEEEICVSTVVERVYHACMMFIESGIDKTMSQFNNSEPNLLCS